MILNHPSFPSFAREVMEGGIHLRYNKFKFMEKERQKILENLWVRVLLIGLSIIIFLVLCYFLRGTLISLLLAFIVAYIFDPVVDFF